MTNVATATLAYGYYLGSTDHGWMVKEADRFGSLNLDWYSDLTGHETYRTFIRSARERLTGHKTASGLTLLAFGCLPYEMNVHIALVTTPSISATDDWGDTISFDPPGNLADPEQAQWDEQLGQALAILGLTPQQEIPRWTVFPTYG
jgi:hypothetical protein